VLIVLLCYSEFLILSPLTLGVLELIHLRHVLNETWGARTKWDNIGLDLRVDKATIESISISKMKEPENCYPEMLTVWLRRGEATWDQLLEVLESDFISFKDIPKKIRAYNTEKLKKIGYY